MPSHSAVWQSPAIWRLGGRSVEAATFAVPHVWLVHVAVTHALAGAGQSEAVSQPMQPATASQTLPVSEQSIGVPVPHEEPLQPALGV